MENEPIFTIAIPNHASENASFDPKDNIWGIAEELLIAEANGEHHTFISHMISTLSHIIYDSNTSNGSRQKEAIEEKHDYILAIFLALQIAQQKGISIPEITVKISTYSENQPVDSLQANALTKKHSLLPINIAITQFDNMNEIREVNTGISQYFLNKIVNKRLSVDEMNGKNSFKFIIDLLNSLQSDTITTEPASKTLYAITRLKEMYQLQQERNNPDALINIPHTTYYLPDQKIQEIFHSTASEITALWLAGDSFHDEIQKYKIEPIMNRKTGKITAVQFLFPGPSYRKKLTLVIDDSCTFADSLRELLREVNIVNDVRAKAHAKDNRHY